PNDPDSESWSPGRITPEGKLQATPAPSHVNCDTSSSQQLHVEQSACQLHRFRYASDASDMDGLLLSEPLLRTLLAKDLRARQSRGASYDLHRVCAEADHLRSAACTLGVMMIGQSQGLPRTNNSCKT